MAGWLKGFLVDVGSYHENVLMLYLTAECLESEILAGYDAEYLAEGARWLVKDVKELAGCSEHIHVFRKARLEHAIQTGKDPVITLPDGGKEPCYHDAAIHIAQRFVSDLLLYSSEEEVEPGVHVVPLELPEVINFDCVAQALAGAERYGDINFYQAELKLEYAMTGHHAPTPPQAGQPNPETQPVAEESEWSRPMALAEAARLLGCQDTKKAAYMRALMADGIVTGREINRQKWEFAISTIDPAVRDQFKRDASS